MLQAEQLKYGRNGRRILDGISVTLRPGEVLAVLGPNGAGKSTLMNLLCGDLSPDSGTLLLEGRPLASWTSRELAAIRAVLPQASELNFPLQVLEVVLLGRSALYGANERESDVEIALNSLERVDLKGFEKRLYTTLSGGEKQRVHLARVLAQLDGGRPGRGRYYFLDEPTSSLDIGHQQGLLRTAGALAREEGASVVAVLHDLNLAAAFADRVLILQKGHTAACGSPREVLTAEIIGRVFGLEVLVQEHPHKARPLIIQL